MFTPSLYNLILYSKGLLPITLTGVHSTNTENELYEVMDPSLDTWRYNRNGESPLRLYLHVPRTRRK